MEQSGFCTRCGRPLDGAWAFCSGCGTSIGDAGAPSVAGSEPAGSQAAEAAPVVLQASASVLTMERGADGGAPEPRPVDDRWLWALVTVPVTGGLIGVIADGTVTGVVGILAVVALNVVFSSLDDRALKAAGHPSPSRWLGALLVPAYLYKRQQGLGRPLLLLWVWIAALVVSSTAMFANVASDLTGNEIDAGRAEASIQDWFRTDVGVSGVDVDCPGGIPAKRGETFRCVASDGYQSAVVSVEVQNNSGDIVWEVR